MIAKIAAVAYRRMRQRTLYSTDSAYSSIFDRYSQECGDAHLSELSHDSFIEFGKRIKTTDTGPLNPGEEVVTYSHYEPVNNILSSLLSRKLTVNSLKQRASEYEIETTSYCQYWGIKEESYQVINMLEPDLLKDQVSLFHFYQHIKRTNLELKIISRHYIPELINQEHSELSMEDKGKILRSFHSISDLFASLQSGIAHLMESRIVVNANVISAVVGDAFARMDTACDSFAMGIVILSDAYNVPLQKYFLANGKRIYEQIGLEHSSMKNTDLLPYPLLAKYCLTLSVFDLLPPFELINVPVTKAIDHCKNIQTKLEKYRGIHRTKILLARQSRQVTSSIVQTFLNFPSTVFSTCILLPFVVICWVLFSLKALFSPRPDNRLT